MKKITIILSTLSALSMLILIPNTANAQTLTEESINYQYSNIGSVDCPFRRCHGGL